MTYSVKECFYTLQGEGAHTGRGAVFLRFAGCNLWNGLEKDRQNAICKFCDTDFIGTDGENGGKFESAENLANHAFKIWQGQSGKPYIVCTGGEPLLQLDSDLIDALHNVGFEIAIESNGTIKAPEGIDHICISPKIGAELVQKSGQEIKLVYPQINGDPEQFAALNFENFFLQPLDDANYQQNLLKCIDYCKNFPKWRLSLQTHKIIGIA
ncbi:MAG: 7-carboxy-7-deazaguanine synthase [Caulobacterales bacterium]|nr:7-carboxy-7-deazaguanine synthase [Caulobacterales bacterium]MCA0372637.1 7-carboxy-7-deazaguanine synthase [Pseudomonadota bacterium]